jgi:hypothetical protein
LEEPACPAPDWVIRESENTVTPTSLSLWEKREHGKCGPGHHLPYRVRKPFWVEVHCKLCLRVEVELYENSFLKATA